MNKQDKPEPDNQQSGIEDLTVNDAQSVTVNGSNGSPFKVVIDPRPH